jgi:hypothetical protein
VSIDAIPPTGIAARVTPIFKVRAFALPARTSLAAIVALSFAVRLLVSLGHATPRYFPDEYIYSALARSVAGQGSLSIRGVPAHFPALLEPLLAAPFWLMHDSALAYRLTLGLHVAAMSLAAVPVYWLARRLDRGPGTALACAVFAVALPDLVYANYLTADAIAYPLALGAIAAAVAALDRPTRPVQTALVVLCALATLARVQYVVLPLIFVLAAVAAERGNVVLMLRRYKLAFALFALPVVVLTVAGPGRVLGYYRGIFDLSLDPVRVGHWIAVDAMVLVYAGGYVLVPGAVLGVLAAALQPRTRIEAAFAHVTLGFAAALLLEAGIYAANGTARFQERYLFAMLPLIPLGFVLGMERRRLRIPVAALAAGLALLALQVPLTGYTVGTGKQASPLLSAVYELEQRLGSYGSGSLVVVTIVAVLCVIAAVTAFRPRVGVALSLGSAVIVLSLASVAVLSYDHSVAKRTAFTYLPADYRFVDHAKLGDVSVLVPPQTPRPLVSEHLFWNESLVRVLLLPFADPPDVFGHDSVRIARDGRIMRGDQPVVGPLLIEQLATNIQLSGAELVKKTTSSALWRPAGVPHVTLMASNRYLDGWLGTSSSVTVWPDASGATRGLLRLHFSLPNSFASMPLQLQAPGFHRSMMARPGQAVSLALPVDAQGPWTLNIVARRLHFLPDGRSVAARMTVPVFVRR